MLIPLERAKELTLSIVVFPMPLAGVLIIRSRDASSLGLTRTFR
jgi:hypothetical protein